MSALACRIAAVVAVCPEEQVSESSAGRIVAVVTHEHPVRDRAVSERPHDAMHEARASLTSELDEPVLLLIARAGPDPALAVIDKTTLDALSDGHTGKSNRLSASQIASAAREDALPSRIE